MKGSRQSESPFTSTEMCVLCPTRWTVRAVPFKSIIDNFDVLIETWDQAMGVSKDNETKIKICGISVQMGTFDYFYG